MRIFNLFKRADTPAAFAKGYDAVRDPFAERQRREADVETTGEDKITPARKRNKLINLSRDLLRNSPESVTQDQQLRVNIVGWIGGKLYAAFGEGYKDAARDVIRYFNKVWSLHAEFTFGEHFNWILKTAITAQEAGGNAILVFDDGILTGGDGTGRIRGFEADEIAAVPDEEFKKRFPATYTQSEGFVYNESGVFCGAFVSSSQRGRKCFDPKAGFITLRCDPFDDETPRNWILIGDTRRFNQGRAVPRGVAALTTAIDLHEARSSEAVASKLNAQLVAQILTDKDAAPAGNPLALPNLAATSGIAAQQGAATGGVKKFSLKKLKAIGATVEAMPPGKKIEMIDTKRPNSNFPAFAQYLQGVEGGVRGLPRVYTTLQVQNSYTGYRGEQKIAEVSFRESQKTLERKICDWAARLVIARAVRLGRITAQLPEYWWEMISWSWPRLPEVSEKEYQSGIQLALKNGTTTLHRILAPGEYEAMREERRREIEDAKADGIVDPRMETVSGSIATNDGGDGGEDTREISTEPKDPQEDKTNE